MDQREITRRLPLLDGQGELTEPGYAKRPLWDYRRRDIKAGALRIKEWDYYYVGNERFGLALTVADNSYMALDSVSLLDFAAPWQVTQSRMRWLTRGKTGLPETSEYGDVASSGRDYGIFFRNRGDSRLLIAHMRRFGDLGPLSARVELTDLPPESMVIATPFDKPGHFYYNQKINCMRASGRVSCGGKDYVFSPEDSFAVLDWGRGVWTYANTWYWASASGLVGGERFGFNLGCGFGDTGAATENMLFYAGRAHKLDQVAFHIPRRGEGYDYLSPWSFSSSDGRLELRFAPVIDRAALTDVKLIKSDQHQVFGRYSGTAVLDGGERLEIKDLFGFAERVDNKW